MERGKPTWSVVINESVIEDLRAFGKKTWRIVLEKLERELTADPVRASRNLKTLRPNPVAQRELRLVGKYRVLFNVDEERRVVTIVLAGEKRGERLFVRGEEFTAHHESDPAE